MKINTESTIECVKIQRSKQELTIENVLKDKFGVYLKNKNLI